MRRDRGAARPVESGLTAGAGQIAGKAAFLPDAAMNAPQAQYCADNWTGQCANIERLAIAQLYRGVRMRQVNRFVILAGAATLGACATQAPAPATVPAVPVVAAAPTPTEKVTVPYGYTTVVVDGETRYCRNDLDTGSRVARTKICYNAAQLKASQDNSQDFMNQVQTHGVGATSTGTPGAGH